MTRKVRFRNVGAGRGIKSELDETTLKRLLIDERLTQGAVARRYGCSPQFVSQLAREYGLARRGQGEAGSRRDR
ncbi:MAG TPA: hypothetical protein VKX16_18725 [Chloroflexota bacterium]|nr:hypothetical protein [Chloroflexota bacterium]